jgi:ABC-type branched-subunit amino acid transport system substrate-binding protein
MKKILLFLVMASGLFTLAACGGLTDDEEVQGVTDDSILVGNTAATSGGFAAVGQPFNAAIEAYFQMINDEGGVAGRDINFVHYDDEFDGSQGQTFTERLVEDDEVFALVGHFGSPTVGATLNYLSEKGIPQVYYASGISALFNQNAEDGERASFPVQPIYDAEGEVMVARAYAEENVSKIGVIYTNADDGAGMLNGIELRAEALGIELVTQQVSSDATDMSSAAISITSEDVDAVIVAANQVPAQVAIKALFAAGNEANVYTSYVNAAASFIENLEAEIDAGQFKVYASAWVNIFDSEGTGFNEGYTLFSETIDAEYASNAYAMAGWIAAHFFVEGLKRVGEDELTWDAYINAMEEDPVENPMGGVVDYADGARVGTQSMALLEATVTDYDTEDVVHAWANLRPIETISSILE